MNIPECPRSFFWVLSMTLILGTGSSLFCLQEPDYKGLFDFNITIKEWDTYVKANQFNKIGKEKLLLLNGIFAEVSPRTSRQNLFVASIKERDLLRPQIFIQKIQAAKTPLTSWLSAGLSENTKSLLVDYRPTSVPSPDLIKSFLKDLNTLTSKQGLFAEKYLADLALSKDLKELIKLQPAGREEQAYVNRLIMEEVFPDELVPFQVQIEVVRGEWLELQDVKSYRASVLFSGPESFKIFHRLRVTEASALMIPLNAPILVVAQPFKLIQNVKGEKTYLLKGIFIRDLQ